MRPALVLLLLAACGPKVGPQPLSYDEDLGSRTTTVTPTAPMTEAERPIAPLGPRHRTGTIARARLLAVLDAGPAAFLRTLEVAPQLNGERFVGWQLVQLIDKAGPLVEIDVDPGDVLLAINGQPLSRPDQLQAVWTSLRTANAVQAQLWRGEAKFTLEFAIEPPVALPGAATPGAATATAR